MTESKFPTVARTVEPPPSTLILRRSLALLIVASVVGAAVAVGLVYTGWFSGDRQQAGGAAGRVGSAISAPPAATPAPTPPEIAPEPPIAPPQQPETAQAPPSGELPARASRLVAGPPQRVVDTRAGDQPAPPPGTVQEIELGVQPSAVVLSVSLLGSERAGAVTVDGLAGPVEAVTVPQAGTTTTNLVIVPVVGNRVNAWSSAGGHLIVDLVATFEAVSGPVAAGRFVPVEPQPVGRLETAVDGRQLDIPLGDTVSSEEADAILVELAADVGADGGVIRSGPGPDDLSQALMWGTAGFDGDQRRGLVLVTPDELNQLSVDYQGGSVLTATVVGYFTSDGAEVATSGLFVPSGPRLLFDGPSEASSPVRVDGLGPDVGTILVTSGSGAGAADRSGAAVVAVDGGSAVIEQPATGDVTVTLLGSFLS